MWDITDNEKMKIEFKPELDINDLRRMKPKIVWLMIDFWQYCKEKNLPCLITSLMEDAPGRKSTTHVSGRAFDASARGWSTDEIDNFIIDFNNKWKNIGTAPLGKPPKAVIFHVTRNGEGEMISPGHFHFQVRRGA